MRIFFCFLSYLFIIEVCASSWLDPGNYDITWYNSSDEEYVISTNMQLAGLAYLVNNGYTDLTSKRILIGGDIDLSQHNWEPINTIKTAIIDGQSHCITGIKIDDDLSNPHVGFFRYISGVSIMNLNVYGTTYFYGRGNFNFNTSYTHPSCGGLVGLGYNSSISNCDIDIELIFKQKAFGNSTNNADFAYIGGIIGQASAVSIINCCNYSDIEAQFGELWDKVIIAPTYLYVGGVVGYAENDSKIMYCGNKSSSLIAEAGYDAYSYKPTINMYIGGISGFVRETLIKQCYNNLRTFKINHGNIAGLGSYNIFVGGICGYAKLYSTDKESGIINCYNSGALIDRGGSGNGQFLIGAIAGKCNFADTKCIANFGPSDFTSDAISFQEGYNGDVSFSSNQMKDQSFVDILNLYPTLKNWEYIWRIVDNYPQICPISGIGEITNSDLKIAVEGNDIIISDIDINRIIYVYDIEGQIIASKKVIDPKTIITVPTKGVYIVVIGNDSFKLIIN